MYKILLNCLYHKRVYHTIDYYDLQAAQKWINRINGNTRPTNFHRAARKYRKHYAKSNNKSRHINHRMKDRKWTDLTESDRFRFRVHRSSFVSIDLHETRGGSVGTSNTDLFLILDLWWFRICGWKVLANVRFNN